MLQFKSFYCADALIICYSFSFFWPFWHLTFIVEIQIPFAEPWTLCLPSVIREGQNLQDKAVSSTQKPCAVNQSGSTAVDAIPLQAGLPRPFSFFDFCSTNYSDTLSCRFTPSCPTTCQRLTITLSFKLYYIPTFLYLCSINMNYFSMLLTLLEQ